MSYDVGGETHCTEVPAEQEQLQGAPHRDCFVLNPNVFAMLRLFQYLSILSDLDAYCHDKVL